MVLAMGIVAVMDKLHLLDGNNNDRSDNYEERKEKTMEIKMICRIIFVAMSCIGIGIAAAKDGDPCPPYSIVSTLIATAIEFGLMFGMGAFTD